MNENLAVLLLAAKYGVPVCPHAGGVGLCELVQHLSMFDYVAVSGSREDRVIEYVDHLHEHFADPAVVEDGHYVAPRAPGFGPDAPRLDRRTPLPAGPRLAGPPHTRGDRPMTGARDFEGLSALVTGASVSGPPWPPSSSPAGRASRCSTSIRRALPRAASPFAPT